MKQILVINKLLLILFMLIPLANYAQKDTIKIDIPMKKGKINYEETVTAKASNKTELYNRAAQWFVKTFPDQQKSGVFNKDAGTISGTGVFKVITSASGNYYWLKFKVDIAVSDSGYTLNTYDYYEKPVEAGITNDYSKISYRWWDYRQGHPWSAEDTKLFSGLNTNSRQLLASFKANLDK